ncbi:MAG: lipopolysaccharide biosynthesis protein, partial [Lactococcus garvieae]
LYLLWSGKTSNFIQLSYVFLFSLCVQFVIGIFLLRRFLSKVFKAKVDFLLFKRIYRFTFPLFFSAFLSWFIYGAPRYMLGWYSSLDEVALFSMAFGFAGIASLIQGVITTVWTPWFFKNIDNGLEQKKFESIISIAGCFLSGVILITGLCSNFVHLFIPEQYSAIANVILLSVFFPILFTLSELTVVGCYVKNKTKLVMLSSAVSAIVCFLISFALSSKLGALGAAFSMFFSGLVLFIMRTEFSRLVWVRFKIAETYLVIFSTCLLSLASFCFSDLIHKLCYWLALIFTFCIYLYKKDFIGRCVFLFKSE